MKLLKNLPIFAIFTLIWLSGPGPDLACAEAPQATVEKLLKIIKKMNHQKPLTAGQIKANDRMSRQGLTHLDVRRVSEKALGKHWKQLSNKEQDEFVGLLGDLFRYVAFPNSSKFFGEMKLTYGATEMAGKQAIVPLTVRHEEEGNVGLEFVMEQNSNRWRVVDVVLDGVSMRNNLRTQFYKVLKKHDYAELVRRMQKKLNNAKK